MISIIPPIGDPLRLPALTFLGLSEGATDEEALARLHERFPCLSESTDHLGWDEFFDLYERPFVEPREEVRTEVRYVSREQYDRIVKWQNDPLYGEVPYEAVYPGGDPEEPPPPTITDDGVERFYRWQQQLFDLPNGPGHLQRWTRQYLLIRAFRRGEDVLRELADVIHWQPRKDPELSGRLKQWHREHPDHTRALLVMEALIILRGTDAELQDMRIGQHWIKQPIVPEKDLPIYNYIRWFTQRLRAVIRNEVLAEYATRPEVSFNDHENTTPADDDRDPTEALDDDRASEFDMPQEGITDEVAPLTDNQLRNQDRAHRLRQAKWSPLQQQIVDLTIEHGRLTRDELARLTGSTPGSVKDALRKIREKLNS